MLTGRSKRACLCREVPTDHEAHGPPNGAVAAELEELLRECTPDAEAEHAKHDRIHAQAVCQSKKRRGREPEQLRS